MSEMSEMRDLSGSVSGAYLCFAAQRVKPGLSPSQAQKAVLHGARSDIFQTPGIRFWILAPGFWMLDAGFSMLALQLEHFLLAFCLRRGERGNSEFFIAQKCYLTSLTCTKMRNKFSKRRLDGISRLPKPLRVHYSQLNPWILRQKRNHQFTTEQ